jgi:hypothetical protein
MIINRRSYAPSRRPVDDQKRDQHIMKTRCLMQSTATDHDNSTVELPAQEAQLQVSTIRSAIVWPGI